MSKEQEEQDNGESRTDELEHTLAQEKERSEEYLTRLKYMQADFENLKKRTAKQMEEVKEYCNECLITELLGVVDELEMAIKSASSSNVKESIVQGVQMTLKKLKKILEKEGVSPIECLGKPFDPSKHAAVAQIEGNNAEECTVIEEIRRGYLMKEKVIRPSAVKVAVKTTSKSQEEMNSDE